MEQWAEAGVGNCVNFGVFYAKEVPPLGRKNLSLHPLHSPISTFTPHFTLTASRPALDCSESQLHSNPRCRAGQSLGQGGTSTAGGSLDPAGPPRPQDYSSQMPAPLPSPRKTQRPREYYCVSIWLPQVVCPRVRLRPQFISSMHHRLHRKPCSPQPAPFPAQPLA